MWYNFDLMSAVIESLITCFTVKKSLFWREDEAMSSESFTLVGMWKIYLNWLIAQFEFCINLNLECRMVYFTSAWKSHWLETGEKGYINTFEYIKICNLLSIHVPFFRMSEFMESYWKLHENFESGR